MAAGETLTVDGVAVTVVTSHGKVILDGDGESDGGKLLLKGGASNAGKLVVDSNKETETVTSQTAITIQATSSSAATDGTVTGTGIVIKAASATPTTASLLGSISGGTTATTNDATISGPSTANDTTIANGAYVKTTDG